MKEITVTAARFCSALCSKSDPVTPEWHDISSIAKSARIRDPRVLSWALSFAVGQGWVERGEESKVRVTSAGQALRPQADDSAVG